MIVPDRCILRVKMALAHHTRYQDGTTRDNCFHVLAERVKDMLLEGSQRGERSPMQKESDRVDATSNTKEALHDGKRVGETGLQSSCRCLELGPLLGCPPLLEDQSGIDSND